MKKVPLISNYTVYLIQQLNSIAIYIYIHIVVLVTIGQQAWSVYVHWSKAALKYNTVSENVTTFYDSF